MTKPGNWK